MLFYFFTQLDMVSGTFRPRRQAKNIYKHPILQKAINTMWFKNKRDEGVVYPDLFSPISVPSIALILTAVSKFQRLFHESNPSTQ